ncbi:MAG: glucose PTS transporter subunit IIA [Lachnospiraceae bacterium]|jgi:glucose-specific phosphotransferase system IIA component|nr:glucose PTS transporter subunit IIA [Lachnospiraceae bacterium]MEE3460550.1 glucose PTS transporter subunit IIA [Lachnospiraceae bacterium]
MALDYKQCAKEIYETVGKRENLVSAAHCATRLRLVTVDNSKVDIKKLDNIEGVKGVFESNGQLQIIIGTGTVNKVYDEFLAVSGMSAATKDDVKAAAAKKQPVWKRMLKTVGDVFVPILPAIVASGLMMGIVEALGKVPGLGFVDTDWYAFLDMVANTAFAFLPVIVAISAARVFGGNIFLGAVVGLLMVHTSLLNGWNVGNADAINSFFGITTGELPQWHLFGDILPINRSGYQGHVIPVIIAIYFMSKLEAWLHKHVPEMIDLFVTPLVTVFVTALLTFTIIGPIFSTAETYVLSGAKWLVTSTYGIGAIVMGALYPVTVVMGLHHMYNVIEAGMLAEGGLNIWMPIATAANFAQFGACLAVGIKTHRQKTKAVAIPSALSASLGITEPAIFGVNLRFMKPFVCGMIGGAVGAFVASMMKIGATAYGVTGIPGYLTINNPGLYTIVLLVAGGVAFTLVMFFWKGEPADDAAVEAEAEKSAEAEAEEKAVEEAEAEDKAEDDSPATLYNPIKGNVIALKDIPDQTFAAGILGEGVGIEPEEETVYAPCDGQVSMVFDTKHAIGLTGPKGVELLIHVGLDTVDMKGDGFDICVKEGDSVKRGDKLMTFSKKKITAAGHSTTTAFIVSDPGDCEVTALEPGKKAVGDEVITIK